MTLSKPTLIVSLFFMVFFTGCGRQDRPAAETAKERETLVYTHFSGETELFVELPALTVGQVSPFAAHFTWLRNFRPVAEGTVTVVLSDGGQAEERFTVDAPRVPGIFVPVAEPRLAGERRLSLELMTGNRRIHHDLGEVRVYPDLETAVAAAPAEEADEGNIPFLKEQQWQIDFATAAVARRRLQHSVPATAVLRPAAGAEAYVTAPASGRLTSYGASFPKVGMTLESGQILATLVSRLGGDSDFAQLQLDRDRARSRYQLAQHELGRLEHLLAEKAIPRHRVVEAKASAEVARAELNAAEKRLAQYSRQTADGASGIKLYAPIAGVLAEVDITPGGYVEEGARLFRIINPSRLWLEGRIAEADLARMGTPERASFSVEGFPRPFELRPGENSRLLAFGRVVDPVSRTVPVIFEIDDPDPRLAVGMLARARIFGGDIIEALALPESALIDDNGQDVTFVQAGGESFQHRVLRLGLRDSGWVEVLSGLAEGERVVVKGTYLVHLAASSPGEAGHGHAH